jgi:ABC-type multidrug transport system ATPase subunit
VLLGTATVWEYLTFHHSLRVEPCNRAAQQQAIHKILEDLGLTLVAHSMIGDSFTRGLSGGERRRVSIAVELLTMPCLLFLDEPTTGLDATNAKQVVNILAHLSSHSINVMLSIHQPRPDILRLLQRVLLLSSSGTLVYSGPVSSIKDHLAGLGVVVPDSTLSIADFLLDTVIAAAEDEQRLDGLVTDFAHSRLFSQELEFARGLAANGSMPAQHNLRTKYIAPFWQQIRVLSTSLLRNTYRHPFLVATSYVSALVAAVTLGIAFWDSGFDTQVWMPRELSDDAVQDESGV